MRVTATAITAGDAIAPTTVTFSSSTVTVVATETEQGPAVLSLLLGGRLAPSAGSIETDAADIRRAVALVDTPDISAPAKELRLDTVVSEELMLAGRASGRRAVREFLTYVGAADLGRTQLRAVPPSIRLTVLAELAAARPGVEAIIITSPERHGGSARDWREIAQSLADRGLAVLVVTSAAAASALVSRPEQSLLTRSTRRTTRRFVESRRS